MSRRRLAPARGQDTEDIMGELTTGTPRRELLKGAAGVAAGAAAVSMLGGGSVAAATKPAMSMTLQDVGTFEVLAWTWGVSNSGSLAGGGGGGAGKASFQDMSVTRYRDVLTPKLLQLVATGGHVVSGRLDVASKDLVETFEFRTILVTSLSTGGSSGEDRQTENASLAFGAFDYVVGPNSLRWNIVGNGPG
jgi:type VI secretion system secreted protein Hcp